MFKKSLSAAIVAAGISFAPISGHAALLGLTLGEPTVDFGGAGIVAYDAATGIVTISGTPATIFQSDPFILGEVLGTGADDEKLVTIKFKVDANGAFVSGVDGPDFVVTGSVDTDFDTIPNYDGVLLQGEVTQFGFLDGTATGASDNFDVRVQFDATTPGALAPLYTNKDLGVSIVSEVSAEFPTPFAGNFATSFTAQAKGVIGSVDVQQPPPPPVGCCKLDVEAYCSVDGGPFKSKCRIKATKSPKHWEHEDFDFDGHSCRHSTYGLHGSPVPSWANRYQSTPVTFKYVVTNKGTTPILSLTVKDSFDSQVTGVPATLAPGESVTLVRTENLYEEMDVAVKVFGINAPNRCGDKDVVVVKDKLRERREHDDDHFRDKGRR